MANVTQKINLAALKHVEMELKKSDGTTIKGMFIPYEANHIFVSDKGGRNIDLISFELKEKKEWGTHMTKQSLPKDVREKMTEQEQKDMPIFGNLNIDGSQGNKEASTNAAPGKVFDPTQEINADDLPF